ncbi:MAG TPA: cyclic nucleotide-binding domain-containing protein [Solirubrobacteraceae bacterium]|nr:cyclic nucleotide-binding domain-containing protein [Solirubrobacteraceae bacterium]
MQRRTIGSDGAQRLEKIPLFAELSPGQRQMLARVIDELTAAAGETLMRQGEPGYEVLILEEGTADVLQDGVRINEMGPGDFFGELAVLEVGAPRSATVVASAPLRAIVLTARFMRDVRERMPDVGEHIDREADARRERDERAHGHSG